MKTEHFPHVPKVAFFLSLISVLFLTVSCENEQLWNAPIKEWFDEYTNTAAVEEYQISYSSVIDNESSVCIDSNSDKTVTFLMRNPRDYTLDMTFTSEDGTDITCTQNVNDKTSAHITFPQSFLLQHEGGGQIGGRVTLTEHETLREFTPYEFSMKCNTPPPQVKGQAIMVSAAAGSKYVVCFYLPSTELNSSTHNRDTHTIFIDENAIASGTVSELLSASQTRPSDLTRLSAGIEFDSAAPSGYSAFYYVTDRVMQENDNLSWHIRIEDDDGLTSRTMTASTIVREAHMSITGGEEVVITTNEGTNTGTIRAEVDEGTVKTWTWTSDSQTVATVSAGASDSSQATITAAGGGVTTIHVEAELTDGRVVRRSKNVRVLAVSLGTETDSMIVNGDAANLTITPVATAFPTTPSYTWQSSNTDVATVNASGAVTAVSYGTAVITASASYGGKTVISSAKTISVYEVSEIQGDSIGFVGTGNDFNVEVQVTGPDGNNYSSFSQIWHSSNTDVAPVPSVTNTNARKVTPASGGTTNISVDVTVAGKTATRQKTLTIYDLVVSGNTLLSRTGASSSLTLTPSLKSGSTTYGESVTYSYSSANGTNATVNTTSGVVTAKSTGDGSETITVTATVNGKTLTKTHTVYVISVSGNTNFIAGESAPLTATTKPIGYTYSWATSNPSRAQVVASTGMVTAISEGSTTIALTVTKGSESLTVATTITTYALSISGNTLYAKTAGAKTLTASLKNGSTSYSGTDITYSWSSGTTATATINASSGSLTPVAGGSTVITLSAKRNGTVVKTVTKTVYVVEVSGNTSFIAGETPRALSVTHGSSGASLTWSTGDSTKATVNASTGKITTITNGSTSIILTATKGSETLTITTSITIYTLSISGNTLYDKTAGAKTLTASLKNGSTSYSGTDITYSWSSGTTATATINASSGSMTPVAGGSTVITLSAKRNGTIVKTATKTVYVIEVKGCTNFIAGENPRSLTVSPSNITGATYSWTNVSGQTYASTNSSGVITASAKGSATVRLAVTTSSEVCNINVPLSVSSLTLTSNSLLSGTTASIAVGEKVTFTYTLDPAFTPESTSFTSATTSKATVASGTLTVTGVATGTSNITVTMTKNGSTLKKQILTASIIANHSVSKANLNTWLAGLPANTTDTPYKINITGLTESDIQQQENGQLKQGTLRAILRDNSTKYVDLSSTTLPAIESIKAALASCSSLIRAPAIPSGVKDMSDCFASCSNLQSPVVIPNGVENMWSTFENCKKLTQAPTIPGTVTDMSGTFRGCTSLLAAPEIPASVKGMNFCFSACSAMTGTVKIHSIKIGDTNGDYYTSGWAATFAGCTSITSVKVKNSTVRDIMLQWNTSAEFNLGIDTSIITIDSSL